MTYKVLSGTLSLCSLTHCIIDNIDRLNHIYLLLKSEGDRSLEFKFLVLVFGKCLQSQQLLLN